MRYEPDNDLQIYTTATRSKVRKGKSLPFFDRGQLSPERECEFEI